MNIPTGNVSLTGRPTLYDYYFIFNIDAFLNNNDTGPANIQDYCTLAQRDIADTDGNNRITTNDPSLFFQYLKYVYNKGTMTIEDWITAGKPKYDRRFR